MVLGHRHEGQDLEIDYARDTLRNLERIWRRPASILTVVDDKPKRVLIVIVTERGRFLREA